MWTGNMQRSTLMHLLPIQYKSLEEGTGEGLGREEDKCANLLEENTCTHEIKRLFGHIVREV